MKSIRKMCPSASRWRAPLPEQDVESMGRYKYCRQVSGGGAHTHMCKELADHYGDHTCQCGHAW